MVDLLYYSCRYSASMANLCWYKQYCVEDEKQMSREGDMHMEKGRERRGREILPVTFRHLEKQGSMDITIQYSKYTLNVGFILNTLNITIINSHITICVFTLCARMHLVF